LNATLEVEVEEVAQACVIAALRKLHFSVVQRDATLPGPGAIEAWKGMNRIFVKVNMAVSPAEPRSLTHDQEENLRNRAARADSQAWEARVLLGPDLELAHLEWRPLE